MTAELAEASNPISISAAGAADSDRVRVIHLVSTLNIGGLEKVVYDLVRYADRDRFDIRILCLGEIGAMEGSFRELDIPVESLGVLGQGTWRASWALRRRLRELRPDVLHTHNPAPHLIGSIAARLARVPVVLHTKHGRNYPHDKKKVFQNRFASWLSDVIVPVSGDAADVARVIEKVPAGKVHLIRNGIDLASFPEVERPPIGRIRRAIHVARLIYPTKDQKTLMRAVRLVADREPTFVLDVVGDGPHRADIELLCDELQLREHVRFLGYRRDVHELLGEAEFFVLSSVKEGLSLTLLEAMATGLPIVATRVGGNGEVVAEGETGFLVPAEDPEAMAAAILAMLDDSGRARAMGRRGRRRVEEHFDLQKVVREYEGLYVQWAGQR